MYLNTNNSFPICMFVVIASRKCELHIYFTFLQEFWPPHIRKSLNFFRLIYVAMSNNQFWAFDNVKMTSKHIIIKVSFKITVRKTHVYLDIRWPWIWKQYLHLGISIDDRPIIMVLPSFQLATHLNTQDRIETEFINEI